MSNEIPVARTAGELRKALDPHHQAAKSIGLVPTMGALHEGHLSLIRRARQQCDFVAASVFLNPSQFNNAADLERYPRAEEKDVELAGEAGANLVFAPSVQEVYPRGFATQIRVTGFVAETLEGAIRGPEHFYGVATIVAKLFNILMPDVAYFGQKDAQQVAVIRRLVVDLDLAVRLEVCPTVREPDGLALSSRNVQLSAADRERAVALHVGLAAAAAMVATGERSAEALLGAAREAMQNLDVVQEYLALVEPDSFREVQKLEQPALLVVAAQIGQVRLIDNALLDPATS